MEEKKTIQNDGASLAVMSDYGAEIVSAVRSSLSPKLLREKVLSYHENDVALALGSLSREERARLYNVLDSESLANILEYSPDMLDYVRELNIKKRVDVLSHAETATAVDVLREMEKPERDSVIDLMDDETRSEIKLFNSFGDDEIGSRMSANYVEINDGATIKEAMASLIRQAAENDNIATIYVVDEKGAYCGAIDLKDLIIAREGTKLEDIMSCSYPYVYARSAVDECISALRDYSEDSVPVLDNDNKLIGVITAQDLVDVVEDELSEDYARFAGLSSEEELSEPIPRSVIKRLPWLVVLLGLALVVSSVVGVFEAVVRQLPIIMCFQSMILDMAGNVGTQSLAVAIRVLTDEKISSRKGRVLIAKETCVGFANGLILGLLSFAVIGLYLWLPLGNAPTFAFAVSGCLGAAMALAMLISAFAGTAIPMAFQKIGIDPAVASGPLITTINDLVAVVAYYGLARVLLIDVMHLAG